MRTQAVNTKPAQNYYDWLLPYAVVGIVFIVYALTAARTVTLEDDGLFIMASMDAGVAHPPGYPLYALLGHLFSYLPLDSPALRIHLLSGLLGALACGVLFVIGRLTGLSRWFALATALAYGASEHFWSQAVIAEVYTLNALLCFGVLLFCLRALQDNANVQRELVCAAVCFGLGLANHWPLMSLAFPAFGILLLMQAGVGRRVAAHAVSRTASRSVSRSASRSASRTGQHGVRSVVRRCLPKLLLITLATATVFYLWMVWRSWQPDVVSFYGPIDSVEKFWYYISRQGYGGADVSPSAGLVDKLNFLWHFFREVFFLFSPVGVPLALLGLYRLHHKRAHALLAATVWIFLAHSLLLILLLGFDYDFLKLAVFRPYPLVAYGTVALWMGNGLALIWEWLRQRVPGWSDEAASQLDTNHQSGATLQHTPNYSDETTNKVTYRTTLKVALNILPALALLIPILLVEKNFSINDRSNDHVAENYARLLLEELEAGAVLFVTGDLSAGPVGYMHAVAGVRPDVTLMSTQGLIYPNRLFSWQATREQKDQLMANFVRDASQPVYFHADLPHAFGTTHFGFYKKVERDEQASAMQVQFADGAERYFESLVQDPKPLNSWNRHLHDQLMWQYGQYMGYMMLSGVSDRALHNDRVAAKLQAMQDQYYGLIGMADIFIRHGDVSSLAQVQEWLQQADSLLEDTPTLSKEMQGRHYYRLGYAAYRLGNPEQARQMFNRSLQVYNHPGNAAIQALELVNQ
ncbi:MAG: glycosyltransferase family 117 protein [Pseudohongiellaceae bacterium]